MSKLTEIGWDAFERLTLEEKRPYLARSDPRSSCFCGMRQIVGTFAVIDVFLATGHTFGELPRTATNH